MKRFGIILLICCLLMGCQGQSTSETMLGNETYSIENTLEYTIVNNEVVDAITPTNKNNDYDSIDVSQEDYSFVDVVMKVKNISDEDYELSDMFSGYFKVNKLSYDIHLAIESNNYNSLSTTDALKSGEERYIHIYCEMEESQLKNDTSLEFNVLNQISYIYTFSTYEETIVNEEKNIGDEINLSQSMITISDVYTDTQVTPSDKGLVYSYIPVDNEDEVFKILKLELRNDSEESIDPREYLYCTYAIDDDSIQSQIIIESENHKKVSQSGSIDTQTTRTLYLTMTLTQDQVDSGHIELFVEGSVFRISE
ncbi:MAG: hypothetical protein LUG46_08250 [Erysipelotrichaceae bacterium]|nr:hypothetical protein [Erysipelotrichaceae bacterium]